MELDQVPAVCIPPGAHLFMNHIPEWLRGKFALQAVEDVTFVQLSADAYRYRDGIRFRNGKQVLLQEVTQGVHFEVLSLASSHQGTEANPQRIPDPGSTDGPVFLQVANFPNSNPYQLNLPIDNAGGRSFIDSTSYQVREDLNWTKGTHSFAFGGNYVALPVYYLTDSRIQGPTVQITAIVDGDQNNLFITGDRPGSFRTF